MEMLLNYSLLVCFLFLHHVTAGPPLSCVSCDGTVCPTEPTNCALDRVPCGCCNVCSLTTGNSCHAFSPSCGPGLMCLTNNGIFDERPPWFSTLKGTCVYTNSPTLAPTSKPIVGRQVDILEHALLKTTTFNLS